ncbi:hypothetical protein HDU93_000795 [Gonapodya sp. JEL0774]|nr:hypothetical protein HDU93_000795 [Gonapodya sp. JEL0774]
MAYLFRTIKLCRNASYSLLALACPNPGSNSNSSIVAAAIDVSDFESQDGNQRSRTQRHQVEQSATYPKCLHQALRISRVHTFHTRQALLDSLNPFLVLTSPYSGAAAEHVTRFVLVRLESLNIPRGFLKGEGKDKGKLIEKADRREGREVGGGVVLGVDVPELAATTSPIPILGSGFGCPGGPGVWVGAADASTDMGNGEGGINPVVVVRAADGLTGCGNNGSLRRELNVWAKADVDEDPLPEKARAETRDADAIGGWAGDGKEDGVVLEVAPARSREELSRGEGTQRGSGPGRDDRKWGCRGALSNWSGSRGRLVPLASDCAGEAEGEVTETGAGAGSGDGLGGRADDDEEEDRKKLIVAVPELVASGAVEGVGVNSEEPAPQPELLEYIISVAEKFKVRSNFTFNIKVTRCVWSDTNKEWSVYYKDMNKVVVPEGTTVPLWRALTDPLREVPGATSEADEEKKLVALVNALPEEHFECDFLFNTTRFTGSPGLPRIPGALEGAFKGDQFHSMRWPKDGLERVRGKKVAMIGCAAAAAQLVPQVQPLAGHLDLYHRTPNHFMHRPNDPYPEELKKKLADDPMFMRMWREDLGRRFDKNWSETGFLNGEEHKWSTEDAKSNLYDNIKDPKLREALWPDFPIWCRRVCFHNDFYPAIAQPNCTVILDRIVKINETGIVTAAQNAREEKIDESAPQTQHDYDVIIYATGWAVDGNKEPVVQFTGRKGASLQLKSVNIQVVGVEADGTPKLDLSKVGPFNYYAGMVDEFPNLFQPGSPPFPLGSVIAAMETSLDYILKLLKYIFRHNIKTIYPKHEAIEVRRRLPVIKSCVDLLPDGTYVTRLHFPGSALEYLQLHQYPVWEDFETEVKGDGEQAWAIPSEPVDTPWDNVHKAIHIVKSSK